MANAWMPEAGRVKCGFAAGGRFLGGAPRAVWRTTETDPRVLSARSVAQRLDGDGHSAHLVWNPLHGDVAQLLPATAPAGGQLSPPPGGGPRSVPVDTSADPACEGRTCLVIVVIGRADEPFTDGPLAGAGALLRWLGSWGVPRSWPGGTPPPSTGPRPAPADAWSRGGHFGASQVPGCPDRGPGAIDTGLLLGAASSGGGTPAPPSARPLLTPALPAPPYPAGHSDNGAAPPSYAARH
ncbi:hypothetical protein J0910_24310 [Nocardiopsis sp. CNT-189]|uniref:hypothetical protein n=1 Tax=Nocardiopsis oceanisediminis TaxID=2816862 RepID=UPI003B36557A